MPLRSREFCKNKKNLETKYKEINIKIQTHEKKQEDWLYSLQLGVVQIRVRSNVS